MADVRLGDIAKELNISTVTVSNALSGKKGVSDSLREKIVQKAEELGYRRGQSEEEKKFRIGALVLDKYVEIGASFYWEMYQHVAFLAAKKLGTTMIEIVDKEKEAKGEMPQMVLEKAVDGLLIIGWMRHDYVLKLIETSGIPVVLLDFQYKDLPCDAVVSENYLGSYKVTRYLIERGHRDIGFVGSIEANENIMDRYFGFRKALGEYGCQYRQEWLLKDRENYSGDMLKLELPRKMPTAFVCNSDYTASLLYDTLMEKQYRVPEDVSIVAYDNYLYGHSFAEELTTYNVNMEKMASSAVKILMAKLRGDDHRYGVSHIDSVVVERSSVKRII